MNFIVSDKWIHTSFVSEGEAVQHCSKFTTIFIFMYFGQRRYLVCQLWLKMEYPHSQSLGTYDARTEDQEGNYKRDTFIRHKYATRGSEREMLTVDLKTVEYLYLARACSYAWKLDFWWWAEYWYTTERPNILTHTQLLCNGSIKVMKTIFHIHNWFKP